MLRRTAIVRKRINKDLPAFISDWISENCIPSSNSKNTVVCVNKSGEKSRQVIRWRTDTIENMFRRCRVEVNSKFGKTFKRTYFYKCVPKFIRRKKHQEGLCPQHHTGIALFKELLRKRGIWHKNCTCQCQFCATTGCNHGKTPQNGICSRFTCSCCKRRKCKIDWCGICTNWVRPVQKKRTGGGLYWYDEEHQGTRKDMMTTFKKEMKKFNDHDQHVIHHREQKQALFDSCSTDDIIIQTDFIQNIAHYRGRETSQSYYGKRQTQFLSFVIWYFVLLDGVYQKQKLHVDYLSSYLKHNSLYFQKSLIHLLTYLRDDIGIDFKKVIKSLGATIVFLILDFRFGCYLMEDEHISNHGFLFFS